jgi:uncharacterized SAM-binding protein YcdF (DUF218 family)
MPHRASLLKLALPLALAGLLLLAVRHAGSALVVNSSQRSDLILVLAGDSNDERYWKAISLLRGGYARQAMIDARVGAVSYGRTAAELTEDFIRRTTADLPGRVCVCSTSGDSTVRELNSAAACLDRAGAHAVLLVTSDYHTRRALSIARKQLPRYTWTVAAADSGLLSQPRWWADRSVAKDVFLEWQRLAWWELVERHQKLLGNR